MSSISGVSVNVPTTTTTSTSTVTTTTSTTTTVPFYLNLGLSDLPVDLTGLTAPRSPMDSAALLSEILAIADELAGKMQEDRIRAAGSGARSALAVVADALAQMIATSQSVADDQKKIDDLTAERNAAVETRDTQTTIYNNESANFTNADNRVNNAWNSWNNNYNAAVNTINGYNAELANSHTSEARRKEIQNPGGLMDQAVSQRNTAAYYRDSWVKTNSNPDWVERNRAAGARDAAAQKIDEANATITRIDETDMPAAVAQKTTDQATVEAWNALVLAVFSIFAALTAADVSKTPVSDSRTDDFLSIFTDQLQAIHKEASDLLTTDWSGTTVDSQSSSDSTAPRTKVLAVAASLLVAVRSIVDALGGLADLTPTGTPGLDLTNGRFRIG